MSKDKFFVGIKNAVNVRRLLLNSSKDVLDALKDFENFEALKQEKAKYIVELKKVIDEILVLNKKLKGHLPKTPLKTPAGSGSGSRSHGKKKSSSKAKGMTRVASKMHELESELERVEKRLKTLE